MAEQSQVEVRPATAIRWIESDFEYRIAVGPIVSSRQFRCLVADEPTNRLSRDPDAYWPDWSTTPPTIEMVVVPVQPVGGNVARVTRRGHTIRLTDPPVEQCFVDLSSSFENYLQKFTHQSRKSLLRLARRLDEPSSLLSLIEYRAPDEMSRFLDIAEHLSKISWQGRHGGIPVSSSFRARVLDRAAVKRSRGYVLFASRQPIAYAYCPIQGDAIMYEVIGYDPQHATLSPGTTLFVGVLRKLFAESRFEVFDLGTLIGEDYKKRLATHIERCTTSYFLRRTIENNALVSTRICTDALLGRVRSCADFLGVRKRLRRVVESARLSPKSTIEPVSPDGRP